MCDQSYDSRKFHHELQCCLDVNICEGKISSFDLKSFPFIEQVLVCLECTIILLYDLKVSFIISFGCFYIFDPILFVYFSLIDNRKK